MAFFLRRFFRYNLSMRKFLFAIILLLSIYFVFAKFSELQNVVDTLQKGNIWLIIACIFLEMAWYLTIAASYRSIYHILGMDEKLKRLMFLAFAAFFANVIAPSAGVSGVAVFIGNNKDNKYSNAKITIAGALFVLFDYVED